MVVLRKMATALAAGLGVCVAAHAVGPKAEVIHWWTSGGESAAVKVFSDAYTTTGGVWVDTAVALGEQARSVAINRIVGGNPPTMAQFNTSKQFLDVVEQGMLNNVDEVAIRDGWDKFLPETVLNVVKVKGHYYAAPVNIHMPTWFWYSKAAFKKAGIAAEPKNMDELFAALDKLQAAGLIPLAHGGQPWQENTIFTAVLANVGGTELYLKVMRDRDAKAIQGEAFKNVLLTYKRLQSYVDKGSPGRNWNDATALLITGKAGVQIMGDWAKGEFTAARQVPGKDYGCIAGFGSKSPYIIQGDVFVFPKTTNPEQIKAQKVLAGLMLAPAVQVEFSNKKGSIPVRTDVDSSKMDICAQQGLAIMKDKSRQLGNGEIYLNPDQNGALADILTAYWNKSVPVEKVQKDIANALKN
ncbi:extracellular solute-binding protein, family 1 [Rhodoferax ferrireducens T118]|uniref:Probable sugar-binding periplasmic protein n=1 Tax=Albidiferax ferrireducens (strain ATCC BAA-621 / DSM 15236 / T118) TaxID=338969 RepID=Q21ZF2_ALBFT|nr:ABC transporter substrate-binding protein [Rhodoferax ferrireducens]ABD68851.1 extracellular solute-binding protein, family 1 [Rhodoferax ferrireducens T118]